MLRGCLLLGALVVATAALADDPFLRRTAAVEAVQSAGPAVVNVTTEQIVRQESPFRGRFADPFFDRFFQDFFEPHAQGSVENLGSGVLIDAAGHVLTNEHVVARATRIKVSLADGREFDATLLGADPNNDIAVLSVDAPEKLPWIKPGTSSDLMVGEPVIAIGNPFGLSHTVTTGVISALERSIRAEDRVYHGFIQTDASINPGNSGGPLLNAEGKLIGINTAVYNGAQGIGFAIPIDAARRIVAELIEHGEVSPVWLGLEFQDLTPELRSALGLPAGLHGALVNRIRDPSPASRSGVAQGDILTKVDGQVIDSARDFFERLGSVTDGQQLALTLYRDGKERVVTARAEEIPPGMVDALVEQLTGMRLTRSTQGVYTVESVRAGSGAASIGIRQGDLLLAINGRALADPAALRRSVVALRGEARALLVVQRGNGRYQVAIPLG
jgi:serine protease Do